MLFGTKAPFCPILAASDFAVQDDLSGQENDAAAELTEQPTGERSSEMWRADKDHPLYPRICLED